MKKQTLFIVLIISIALGIGLWRDNQSSLTGKKQSSLASLSIGTAFSVPQKLPEFTLSNMDGNEFTNDAFKQKWSFVFFGYTACPDICPMTLNAIHQISQRVGRTAPVQFVFISIDPTHDTPQRLKDYLQQEKFQGTAFIGLTGQASQVQGLAKTIGIYIAQEAEPLSEHIEHSGSLLLINPEGKLAALFTATDKPHAIAHDFKELVHRYAKVA